jgi:hypothetical protein
MNNLEKLEQLIINITQEEKIEDKWKLRERIIDITDTLLFHKK